MSPDAIEAFCDRHPCPPPVAVLQAPGDVAVRAAHHLIWPARPMDSVGSLLVAGCGTSQAVLHALRRPDARVERQPPGAAAALINRAHTDSDLVLFADRAEYEIFRAIDGERTAYEDAAAYAAWAGACLPSEAEWEFAARGGLDRAAFTWGDTARPDGRIMARTWDGLDFPWRGYTGTAPVGSFPANGYGLYDMAGNVWEWTDDWWGGAHEASLDPAQPQFRVPRKVVKGGSHLCADSYCLRYRPGARRPQMIDTGMSHVGFRCAWTATKEET